MHRLLVLWLDLQRAVGRVHSANVVPWECMDPAVAAAWKKMTDPKHQHALEQWLVQSCDGKPAEWGRKALEVCRQRAKNQSH